MIQVGKVDFHPEREQLNRRIGMPLQELPETTKPFLRNCASMNQPLFLNQIGKELNRLIFLRTTRLLGEDLDRVAKMAFGV